MENKKNRRDLTESERNILAIIQRECGPQNTLAEVFFTDDDEAALFVKARDDTSPVFANLTNLALFRADGTIANDRELKEKWLKLG